MADLRDLPTTESGSVRKDDAMAWLSSLDDPESNDDLHECIVPKPYDHDGSTFPETISQIRVTGTPAFIEAVARRFTSLVEFEDEGTRLAINLQQVENRETGELQDDVYALYLSVAERGGRSLEDVV